MKRLAIIPARSGSVGLKDKNILPLCGKPVMVYSIEAATKSGKFEQVIVSTDSLKYSKIAQDAGAQVIMRGEELSNDTASTYSVIEHVLEQTGCDFDYFMLLQPTSPLRTADSIKEACCLFEENIDRVDFLVSVKEASLPSVLVRPIEEDGLLKHFDTDFSNYRRQSYKEYSPNGAIYIGKPREYLEKKHFYGKKSIAFKMNFEESLDIDGKMEYNIIRIIMQNRLEE